MVSEHDSDTESDSESDDGNRTGEEADAAESDDDGDDGDEAQKVQASWCLTHQEFGLGRQVEAALNLAHEARGVSLVRGLDLQALSDKSLRCIVASSSRGGHGGGYSKCASRDELVSRVQAILRSWPLHKPDVIELRDEVCCTAGMIQGVRDLSVVMCVLCNMSHVMCLLSLMPCVSYVLCLLYRMSFVSCVLYLMSLV